MKDNPANSIYQKVIEKYGGSVKEDGNEIFYSINGFETMNNKNISPDFWN
jgi:hypothetical protein